MRGNMSDYLDILADSAKKSIAEGYYENCQETYYRPSQSLRKAILGRVDIPIISEIKFSSPSTDMLGPGHSDIAEIARQMRDGGATGISILTEPRHFKGRIGYIAEVRRQTHIPILMKDIVLSPTQLDSASRMGASAVLLIQALFDRGYCERDVDFMIEHCHQRGLEVLLEAHTEEEYLSATGSGADMIGINNRDLRTLKVDLDTTRRILQDHGADGGRVVVTESGVNRPEDIRSLKDYGVKAFLVGTSIMRAENIRDKVRELVTLI